MTIAARLAAETARVHGRDPWQAAEELQLPIFVEPLPQGCDELYVEEPTTGSRALVIDTGLSQNSARYLVAHGLAHHLLHVGNRVWGSKKTLWSGRHEREADDFASCLLIPEAELQTMLEAVDPPSIDEVADHFGVSVAVAARRIGLLHKDRQRLLD